MSSGGVTQASRTALFKGYVKLIKIFLDILMIEAGICFNSCFGDGMQFRWTWSEDTMMQGTM